LPSWPDIACHHWISVAAWAGDTRPIAAAQTADSNDFKADLTTKRFPSWSRAASYQALLIMSARHWLQSPNAARAAQLTQSTEIRTG
jgi:hypothetical protein